MYYISDIDYGGSTMKYDILLPFRSYLNDTFSNKNTADRYYQTGRKTPGFRHGDISHSYLH